MGRFYIVRIAPSLGNGNVSYVGHDETPEGTKLRFVHFRTSASIYASKRVAVRDARRLAKVFSLFAFKVTDARDARVVWSTLD